MTGDLRTLRIHGHDLSYRQAGEGPVLLLVHGMASKGETWNTVIPRLAESHTVIAPDMLGHGASAKDHTDYSLGGLASSLRDLLIALGHERATLVGHSLGGGIVMQFSYQFPERVERLALVGSGGLGKEVAFILRALSVPGMELLLPPAFTPKIWRAGASVADWLGKIGVPLAPAFEEIWESYGSLTDSETRRSFFKVLRAVVGASGQLVSATDRLYLACNVPTLIVWGEKDSIIPVHHARAAHAAMPGSRLEVLPGVNHFPQRECPELFTEILLDFLATTKPANLSTANLREILDAATV
jgi:pimeloyl-ACP methyl ester carboxylesterase